VRKSDVPISRHLILPHRLSSSQITLACKRSIQENTGIQQVDALLLQSGQCIGPLVNEIRGQRRDGHIEDTDAINLWAAVMQACHYSVAKGQNLSIVVSARMFWFIRLDTTQNEDAVLRYKCCVKISDAHPFGSPSFMRTLVSFITHAAKEKRLLKK
jgi:hypothetical protein